MKITGVRTKLYEFELTRPLGDANVPNLDRSQAKRLCMGVFIDTDEDITGVMAFGPTIPIDLAARSHIHSLVDGLLIGLDPRGVKGHWQKMIDTVFRHGSRAILGDAISAIDIALWDLKAKIDDEPLWKTLGASTRMVKAYASGLDTPLTDEELAELYEDAAKQGISAGKLKVGLDREADLRRLGIMRDALATSGKTPEILIDSNEYWSPKQAIRHITDYERHYEIVWAEEPARRWDYRGLRKVSQGIRAAVATGENHRDIFEWTPLIDNEAVDIVQIHYRQSGITGAMQIADLALAYELPVVTVFCPASYMAHLAAALPNHWTMEVMDAGYEAQMDVDNRIEDGYIVLGDSPGIGLVLDEEKLAPFEVEGPSASGRLLRVIRRRGAGLYEVGPDEPERLPEE